MKLFSFESGIQNIIPCGVTSIGFSKEMPGFLVSLRSILQVHGAFSRDECRTAGAQV